mgnify:CR=1 FL=1
MVVLVKNLLGMTLNLENLEEGGRRCSSKLREDEMNFCECMCVCSAENEREGEEVDLEVTCAWKYEIGCMENQHAKMRWL